MKAGAKSPREARHRVQSAVAQAVTERWVGDAGRPGRESRRRVIQSREVPKEPTVSTRLGTELSPRVVGALGSGHPKPHADAALPTDGPDWEPLRLRPVRLP